MTQRSKDLTGVLSEVEQFGSQGDDILIFTFQHEKAVKFALKFRENPWVSICQSYKMGCSRGVGEDKSIQMYLKCFSLFVVLLRKTVFACVCVCVIFVCVYGLVVKKMTNFFLLDWGR